MSETAASIALITGANEGIGKETARQLAARGVRVIIGSRSLDKGEAVAAALREQGQAAEAVQIDVCDAASVQAAAAEIERRHGRLDILVNNAGIAIDRGPLGTLPIDDLTATFDTNVTGTFRVTQAMLPLLRRSAHARIVNVSSGLASMGFMSSDAWRHMPLMLSSYAASKAALNALTIHWARELADAGIQVNAADPGPTATRHTPPGAHPVEVGAQPVVRLALIDKDGPTGQFFGQQGASAW